MFNFDVRCVSWKFISPPIQKMIIDSAYFISSTWENIRFLSTVDVMLEEYNNCLPNNKWLGVKHASIVFG